MLPWQRGEAVGFHNGSCTAPKPVEGWPAKTHTIKQPQFKPKLHPNKTQHRQQPPPKRADKRKHRKLRKESKNTLSPTALPLTLLPHKEEGEKVCTSLGNRRQRWLIRQTHHLRICAGTLTNRTITKSYTHTQPFAHMQPKRTETFCWGCTGGTSYEVYSLHQKDNPDISDRLQMMMHRDLLPLQRQNKRTDMKEKSINIRHLIKHAFFPPEFTTKVSTVFCLTQHYKKKNQEVLSHLTVISCQNTSEFG